MNGLSLMDMRLALELAPATPDEIRALTLELRPDSLLREHLLAYADRLALYAAEIDLADGERKEA